MIKKIPGINNTNNNIAVSRSQCLTSYKLSKSLPNPMQMDSTIRDATQKESTNVPMTAAQAMLQDWNCSTVIDRDVSFIFLFGQRFF